MWCCFEGKDARLKGSWRAAEARHCVVGLESLRRVPEMLLQEAVKMKLQCSGELEPRTMEMPGHEVSKENCRSGIELTYG